MKMLGQSSLSGKGEFYFMECWVQVGIPWQNLLGIDIVKSSKAAAGQNCL